MIASLRSATDTISDAEDSFFSVLSNAVTTAFRVPKEDLVPEKPVLKSAGEIVVPDGATAADMANPTTSIVRAHGRLLGTESVGTDAWHIYQMPNGQKYRMVAYPQESPEVGRVYRFEDELPPPYHGPRLARRVSAEEAHAFADSHVDPKLAAARVEVSALRAAERDRALETSKREYWQILQSGVSERQQRQWAQHGFFDVHAPNGQRYRVLPRQQEVYQIGPRDEPVRWYELPRDEVLPDALARYILTLGNEPDRFLNRFEGLMLRDGPRLQSPWPLLAPQPGSEAIGRLYALEIA
jgi:hypothetical protein